MSAPLSKLRILAKDGERHYSYAKVDLLDGGNGLLIYDYQTGEKLSRHSDGRTFSRVAGAGATSTPTTSVAFSQISKETVRTVPILRNATDLLPVYRGDPTDALVFSSTVLTSRGTFAAEIVDVGELQPTLAAWRDHPDYVSAQTWKATGTGKAVILTILNQRST